MCKGSGVLEGRCAKSGSDVVRGLEAYIEGIGEVGYYVLNSGRLRPPGNPHVKTKIPPRGEYVVNIEKGVMLLNL